MDHGKSLVFFSPRPSHFFRRHAFHIDLGHATVVGSGALAVEYEFQGEGLGAPGDQSWFRKAMVPSSNQTWLAGKSTVYG